MTLGAVREPRRGTRHSDLTGRRKRELRDVRHSQRPDLRIERVLVSPSGIHVVASLHLEPGVADGPAVSTGDLQRAHAAAGVVASLLPQRYRERVRPVLCRVDDVAMAELVDDVLEVHTDDPAARVGVPAWCRLTRNPLVYTDALVHPSTNHTVFLIAKKTPQQKANQQ